MLMLMREWEQHKTNKWVRSSPVAYVYVAGVLTCLCLCLCLCASENQPLGRKEKLAQKVGRREKLSQQVGRREIYSPVPPPSLWPPGHHFFTICPSVFDFRKALCVFNVFFVQFYSRSFWKHNRFPLNDNERVIILYFLIMHFKKTVLFEWWQNRSLNIIKLQVRREQTTEIIFWIVFNVIWFREFLHWFHTFFPFFPRCF